MYKGKKTLFYNGEKLYEWDEDWDGRPLIYDKEERRSWQVIIVLPGVRVIPYITFYRCENVEVVIMPDTVRRIEDKVFYGCDSLVFIRLSRNLEFIGWKAFWYCSSLTSIFIPPSCREIERSAFHGCEKLIICNVPEETQVGREVFNGTALIKKSSIDSDQNNQYDSTYEEEVVRWVKSINHEEEYDLHRACTSFNLIPEIIHALVKRKGIKAMKMPTVIGITPSQYLDANPFTDISEKEILNRYILDMTGEVI
ncbi:hypothetical protein CTEN210_18442 [Chaetoceros tenuissimus]|uniref:Leucine-rich repeat domain-containing protein n=1 Tax=Chaetoceros tenuissimus TaxID=426638 RepID=A0AAD3HG12_9STRA|nr:hypothetical protein CTEN210_18442 [Chaetoceros tenuissimus]